MLTAAADGTGGVSPEEATDTIGEGRELSSAPRETGEILGALSADVFVVSWGGRCCSISVLGAFSDKGGTSLNISSGEVTREMLTLVLSATEMLIGDRSLRELSSDAL